MASNALGTIFKVSSYGESHGKEVGVLIDGCPPGLVVDESYIQAELDRRKPGQSAFTTQRKEDDQPELVSGIYRGITTGAPILIRIPNRDPQSRDYDKLAELYRPSHADQTYEIKYGIRDHRGGGRASARVTAGWVAAGAIAKLCLKQHGEPVIKAHVRQIYHVVDPTEVGDIDWECVEQNPVRAADSIKAQQMMDAIELARRDGDSLGGVIRGYIFNPKAGLGEPLFEKFHAVLGHALLSLNAVKGISFGEGYELAGMKGSEANDSWLPGQGTKPATNRSGGISGGISNGNTIYFDLAFKPTASISKEQLFLARSGEVVADMISGRHDPCVLPRAVPIVEALTAIVYLDFVLRSAMG